MPKTVRVGVLGAGWGAGLHLEGFHRTEGAEIVAILSRTRTRAEERAAQYGIRLVTDSLDELIDAVDVVSVATPPAVHLEPVLRAVAAGRHVLCDKPLAADLESARSIMGAVAASGVRHASGFIWRDDPGLLRMRELLTEGAIGRLVEIHSTCPLGVPQLPATWMYQADEGGGALAQHGSHVIDRARWLVGAEIDRVRGRLAYDVDDAAAPRRFHDITEAFAWARDNDGRTSDAPRVPVTADTGYDFSADFDNGVRARFWEAWHLLGPVEDEVSLYGEDGALQWRGAAGLWLSRPGAQPTRVEVPETVASGANTPREVGLRKWAALAGRFVEAILTGVENGHPTIVDAWQVAAVSDAVRRSHRSGGWEKVA
ncbi:Gfo/Idh/MocA family protein [Micromonospora carbonacea]|uniref:Gfo/Idh/MocA family oxidoreductase n=1 Tax=Micromonospora carbonacea TaxID=47853 RepID=A0A7H8XKA8_9ACTN|nr:Gfo/Idh/MocA family oxidoreductase [Micromonospora carbonacea]MBB5825920.1 putative dehydrogenase [Micromonospora carbonacea]QLD25513.1 Gfo/Idh/MocA family oxidoreductase [Micromonospora carbonacea]